MTRRIGDVVILEQESDDICEDCGKVDELRPYGPFDKDKGRRLRVCFDCMMKNEPDAKKAFGELLNGKEQ